MSSISDEEILKLYKDINFPASFRGILSVQRELKLMYNYDVSVKRLYSVLRREPIYLMHQRKYRKIIRRPYILHNYGGKILS